MVDNIKLVYTGVHGVITSLRSKRFVRVDARKLEREQKKIEKVGRVDFCSCSKFLRNNSNGNVTTQVMSSPLLDPMANFSMNFGGWAQVKLFFCSLMKFVFAGSFDYSWRLWDLEQLKEVLHQVKYFYSSLF